MVWSVTHLVPLPGANARLVNDDKQLYQQSVPKLVLIIPSCLGNTCNIIEGVGNLISQKYIATQEILVK